MYQNDNMKVLTGEVRLSYANLTTPRAPQGGGEPKYSVTLLIPKTDVKTKANIDASIQAATQDGTAKKWGGKRPAMIHIPLHDGDGTKENGEPFGEECKGCWIISASSKQRPEVVDMSLSPIINASDIYSGMYARVTIRFFAYDRAGKRGIGCGLGNVLKTRDGEALSGHASAESDFAGIAQPAASVSAPAQNYPQYTQQQTAPDMPQGYPQTQQPYSNPQQAPMYQQNMPQNYPVDPITGQPIVR